MRQARHLRNSELAGYEAFKDKRYTGPGSGLGDEWGYELNDARTRKFESPLQRSMSVLRDTALDSGSDTTSVGIP